MIVFLLRHARAGHRASWEGDDRLRPLDARGRKQAEGLVEQLAGRSFERILSSPYARCVQTVVPLARERHLEVEAVHELSEGSDRAALELLRSLGTDVLACVHGDLAVELLGEKARKGSTAVLELTDDSIEVLERLEPPA